MQDRGRTPDPATCAPGIHDNGAVPAHEPPRKLLYVVGARPNFVKMAPVVAELRRRLPDADHAVVHTGQHYDRQLSEIFIAQLEIPEPRHRLDVGSGTHAAQTARAMERLEQVVADDRPDLAFVAGDVNSTLAAALVFAKLGIRYAHVESGLRSFDRSMPEEINRLVTDALVTLLEQYPEIGVVYAIGPLIMMKAVTRLMESMGRRTIVSLNTIMVDGTGMCGGCRVTIGGKMKFACVDGPEFDGHAVDFDELMARNRTYIDLERLADERASCQLASVQGAATR